MPPDLLPCKKVHPACCNFYLVPTTDYVIICNGGSGLAISLASFQIYFQIFFKYRIPPGKKCTYTIL